MKKCLNNSIFKEISELGEETGIKAYVIGGFVRDCLLNTPSNDIDIVVESSGIDFAKRLSKRLGNTKLNYFKNFGTAMFWYKGNEIEIVGARKESYQRNSRNPIVEDGSIKDDQYRRDFTINAMGISLNKDDYGVLTDPFMGQEDLKNKIIRTPLDPDTTFSDDPLRMLRAIRFATRLNFTIEKDCFLSIQKNKQRIDIISYERISEELNKIMSTPTPSKGFLMLEESGLLKIIFPDLQKLKGIELKNGKKHKDNFYHTLQVLDKTCKTSNNLWLRWAALLHDIGKPITKKFDPKLGWTFHGHDFIGSKMIPGIFRQLKLPLNEKMKYVQKLVLLHLRPIALVEDKVSDSAIRRIMFEAGDDIDDLMLLCEADITSKNEKKVKKYLNNFRHVREKIKVLEEKDSIRNFQPPISGEDIIASFKIQPGPVIGEIKNSIKEAILEGDIENNREQAWNYMLKKGKELGLVLKSDNQ